MTPAWRTHGVDEGATGAAVAVIERVDRLELRVGDRDLYQHGQIYAMDERDQVIERRGNSGMVMM